MNNLSYTCFINGIAHETRQKWAIECANYIDKQNFGFDKKIVCFDEFNENKVSENTKNILKNNGWEILIVNFHSRSQTLKHVLDSEKNDVFVYVEDDVLVDMPKKEDTDKAFEEFYGERRCGMISMSVGGGGYDWPSGNWGDLKFIEKNNIIKNNQYEFFIRDENYKTDYFFEFPVIFIKTHIFKTCIETIISSYKNIQIETALTKAWFSKNFDSDYFKCSVIKNNSFNILEKNMKDITNIVFLKFLDADQGNNFWGGNNMS